MFFFSLAVFLYNKHFWPAVHFKSITGEFVQIIAVTGLLTGRATSVSKASKFHRLFSEICIFLLLGNPMLGACVQLFLLPVFTTHGVPAPTKEILCRPIVTLILTWSFVNPNKAPVHKLCTSYSLLLTYWQVIATIVLVQSLPISSYGWLQFRGQLSAVIGQDRTGLKTYWFLSKTLWLCGAMPSPMEEKSVTVRDTGILWGSYLLLPLHSTNSSSTDFL